MPTCQNCNANLPDNAAFCNVCGQQVYRAQFVQQPVMSAAPQPVAQPAVQVPPPPPIPQPVAQTVAQPVMGAAPKQNFAVRKMHCPNCKSSNIQISTESSVNGAVTAHHGGFSTSSVSNTHRNFWFCSDCGTKFRNIQNLEEEIARSKNTHIIFFVFAAISLALFILFLSMISENSFGGFIFGPFVFVCGVTVIVTVIYGFLSISKVKKMRKELEYLKFACYN